MVDVVVGVVYDLLAQLNVTAVLGRPRAVQQEGTAVAAVQLGLD